MYDIDIFFFIIYYFIYLQLSKIQCKISLLSKYIIYILVYTLSVLMCIHLVFIQMLLFVVDPHISF